MGVLSDLLQKIKTWLKAGKTEKDEVVAILGEIFKKNIFFLTGEKASVTLSVVRIEEFEKNLADVRAGFLTCGLHGIERPRFVMLCPAECVRMLLPAVKERQGLQGEGDAVLAAGMMDQMLGNVPRLLRAGAESPGEIVPADYLVMRKAYTETDRDGLLWYASGCTVLHGVVGPYVFFLLIDEETEGGFRLSLEDKSLRKAAWTVAQSAYDPAATPPAVPAAGVTLRIDKPKEFIAGNLLLPQVAAFDRFRIRNDFKKISIGNAGERGPFKQGLWLHMFLNAGGSDIDLYCLVAGLTREDFTKRFGDPSAFFKNILRETVVFLRTAFPGVAVASVKLAVGSGPDDAAVARSLLLEGEMVVNYARMEIMVCVPRGYFSLFFPVELKPWDYLNQGDSPACFLAAVLALNADLFNRNIGTFMKKYRSGLAYLPAKTTCIPLYELMDLMDDRDLRILVQNVLVPKYAAGIAKFFNIGVPVKDEGAEEDEEPRMKIFQVAYDRERINRMMPPAILEEMNRLKEYTPAEEFDSYNKSILKEISKSIAAGTVLFSYKTRYIFIHEIAVIINEDDARRLDDLRSQGIPFARMRKLSQSSLVNVVNKIGNRDLCRSVIDCDGEIPLLLNCMSRSRRREFLDDLEYCRQQYLNGRLSSEDVIAAKLRINSLMERKRPAVI